MPVLVTKDFAPVHGGIQRCMSRLAQELARRDERVVVVAPRTAGCSDYDAAQHYRTSRFPGRDRVTSFAAMTLWLFAARLRARESYTLASLWFPDGLAACLLPRALRGKLAVLAHGSEVAPRRGGLRRHLMRYVFAHADAIVANSRFTRELLLQAGVRRRVSVVHLGIDDTPIERSRALEPVILSVGRLVPRKGFDKVIEALPCVLEAFPTARYEIVGSGPQQAELEALAARRGVRDRIDFLGAVDDAHMRMAYGRAWCFALPVRAEGDDVEGFGLVYLEAAIAGLPAIGGRGSGADDAIEPGETGFLVDGTSSEEVAVAILTLLRDPRRAQIMGERGRARALAQFRWQQTAASISGLMAAADSDVRPLAGRRRAALKK